MFTDKLYYLVVPYAAINLEEKFLIFHESEIDSDKILSYRKVECDVLGPYTVIRAAAEKSKCVQDLIKTHLMYTSNQSNPRSFKFQDGETYCVVERSGYRSWWTNDNGILINRNYDEEFVANMIYRERTNQPSAITLFTKLDPGECYIRRSLFIDLGNPSDKRIFYDGRSPYLKHLIDEDARKKRAEEAARKAEEAAKKEAERIHQIQEANAVKKRLQHERFLTESVIGEIIKNSNEEKLTVAIESKVSEDRPSIPMRTVRTPVKKISESDFVKLGMMLDAYMNISFMNAYKTGNSSIVDLRRVAKNIGDKTVLNLLLNECKLLIYTIRSVALFKGDYKKDEVLSLASKWRTNNEIIMPLYELGDPSMVDDKLVIEYVNSLMNYIPEIEHVFEGKIKSNLDLMAAIIASVTVYDYITNLTP